MTRFGQSIGKYLFLPGVLFVCLIIFITPIQGKTILTKNQTTEYMDKISEYEMKNVTNPTYGSTGGEWLIMGLARYGTLTESYCARYLENLKEEVESRKGILSETKYTEYARVVLALTSINETPENFAGYNLLKPLSELDHVLKSGLNGAVFSLLAFDSGNYQIPDTKKEYTGRKSTREKLISILINAQLEDGGWANMGNKSDVDMTAMVLQALGKYRKQNEVKTALNRGIQYLSEKQNNSGAFSGSGVENCESTAQVLTAMTVLGIHVSDDRFVKNGNTVLDGLLKYYKDGGFKHTANSFVNQMATEQAMYALTAYYRSLTEENGLYEMADNNSYKDTDSAKKSTTGKSSRKSSKMNKKQQKKETQATSQTDKKKSALETRAAETVTAQGNDTVTKQKNQSSRKEKGTQQTSGNRTEMESTGESTSAAEEVKEERKKEENHRNYGGIGIGLAVIVLAGAGIFLKKKNKLFIMLIAVCIFFGGCGSDMAKDSAGTCTILVKCSSIYNNLEKLDKGLKEHIPKDGIILKEQEVSFEKDDSVYDVLARELKKNRILMEASFTANSAYIEGIDNIYEFSCGELSGWMYSVNGEYAQVSCSDYKVKDGDKIQWSYTCDLGEDIKAKAGGEQ